MNSDLRWRRQRTAAQPAVPRAANVVHGSPYQKYSIRFHSVMWNPRKDHPSAPHWSFGSPKTALTSPVRKDLRSGLDTRFERVDNRPVERYGLDLPEVIALRKKLLEETPRRHLMGCSVLDFPWVDDLSDQNDKRDQPEPRLGAFQLMRYFPLLARMERFVQCQLGGAEVLKDILSPV